MRVGQMAEDWPAVSWPEWGCYTRDLMRCPLWKVWHLSRWEAGSSLGELTKNSRVVGNLSLSRWEISHSLLFQLLGHCNGTQIFQGLGRREDSLGSFPRWWSMMVTARKAGETRIHLI